GCRRGGSSAIAQQPALTERAARRKSRNHDTVFVAGLDFAALENIDAGQWFTELVNRLSGAVAQPAALARKVQTFLQRQMFVRRNAFQEICELFDRVVHRV